MSTEPTKIGKYRVLRELGRGTSSRVYLGRDPFADRTVAIKVMLRDSELGNTESSQVERVFHNEAALAGRLTHPHIIEILDADVGNEQAYIVMEYVEGRTLEHFCKVDTLMPLNKVVELAFKCGLALDFASQKGIIHRDIKPANIMMGENGDIKLTDFGIALHGDGEKTQLQGVGSPTYMSPEQIEEGTLTYQTDIYSLGVVMYRLLTGKLPFVASNNTSLAYQIVTAEPVAPSVHRPDLPADFDRIVMKAIAKDVSQRYQTWSDFAQDLGKVNNDLSVKTDTINETEKFSAIQKIRYFSEFGELEIWEMVRIATFRRIQPKETIVPEGDVCESFFLIVSGEARVRKGGQSLSVLGDGDCFGEMPYFEERGPRTSSVVSITPMTIIEVNSTALRLASDACQKQFNRGFLRILLDRIDRLSKANMALVKASRFKPESKDSKVPGAANPGSANPGGAKPAATHPRSTNPVAAKAAATKPQATNPAAAKPQVAKPQATNPGAVKPQVAKPQATNPAVAKPQAANPQVAKPVAANPQDTKPQVAKPETLDLNIELPVSKEPEVQELKIEFPEAKKTVSEELKIEIPEAKKPESQGLKLEDPESSKPASQGLKHQDPESSKPASQGLKQQDPESSKPESQSLKLEDPQPGKPESQGLKLEDPETSKPASQGLELKDAESKASEARKPESQGLKLEDPESSKPASQGLKLEDPESSKPESQSLKLEDPESSKPASQGLKLEILDLDKPESKQPESTAQTR
jgi:CRP-like cAMP-binding protein/predicted Ser/Thr protein kinase